MNTLRFAIRTLLIALTVVLVGVVAACSAPAEDDNSSSGGEYTPVTIEHEFGSTTIEKRPERVVTLLANWTDTLAALDIPITAEFVEKGYAGPNNHFAWTPEHDSEVKVVNSLAALDISEIAAFQPDLILAGYTGDQKNYDRLRALAPTIPVMKKGATVDTWEDIATTAGRIFTKESQAQELVDETNGKIEKFTSDHPNAVGKTFTFAQFQPTGNIGAINSTDDPAAGLLTQLGFTLNPKLAAEHTGSATRSPISSERIDLLDSDLLVAWTLGDDSVYQKVPGWDNLTAVKNDTVVYLTNDNAPAFGVPSAPSVAYVIGLLDPVAARM
ncbi:ABC transporter substrate-binding protein [Gordonia insulae]|uniref:Fe(3+)-citrate-binding protein YfmC n=1 Tax=Gordonia insulae TaxID=2420509 RepID=A0A3G8JIS2_9ACTN|nr:ABC transporter substrate-binding protein [Gordonia insulae]AZG44369.1 Fe(3+)-citrate-binding protein YfmC [Gordonia insulae]